MKSKQSTYSLSHRSIFPIVTAFLIIFFLLGALLYSLFTTQSSTERSTENNRKSTQPSLHISAVPTKTIVAGWNTYTINIGIHKFTIETPKTWNVEGLFDTQYQKIYKDALAQNSIAFPVMNISNPELGFNQRYKNIPFNALIITANKGAFAASKLAEYTNIQVQGSAKIDYFPGFIAYEIKSIERENPADWQDDTNTPSPLKMIAQRRIAVQISSNLVYEISYNIENARTYQNTISIYDQIISTLKFY